MAETATCELCEKEIDLSYEDEYYEDDSGTYHEDCIRAHWEQEASYYLGTYLAHKRNNPPVDYSDAYEWGDPKNPEYVEWAIEQADARRG
jgi:hypothetical protein